MENYITVLEYYYNNLLLVGSMPILTLEELEDYWLEANNNLQYEQY